MAELDSSMIENLYNAPFEMCTYDPDLLTLFSVPLWPDLSLLPRIKRRIPSKSLT